MLRRWLDARIVGAKPNGKDAYFGQVRFITLRDTLLEKIRNCKKVCCQGVNTFLNTGRLHSVL
jgi:hypothetical protein